MSRLHLFVCTELGVTIVSYLLLFLLYAFKRVLRIKYIRNTLLNAVLTFKVITSGDNLQPSFILKPSITLYASPKHGSKNFQCLLDKN